jgi:hypothetical protein
LESVEHPIGLRRAMRRIVGRLVPMMAAAVGSLTIAFLAGGTTAAHAEKPPDVHVAASLCQGSQVVRCLELRYDSANHRFRVWSSVFDAGGGNNYDVKVIWTDHLDNTSAWQDVYDVDHGPLWPCDPLGPFWTTVGAKLAWLHPDGTYEYEIIMVTGYICW